MSSHRLSIGSPGSPPPRIAQQVLDHTLSWTDDLPVCHLSGVGFSTNQLYREDGFRREEHEFEDRSIHFSLEDDVFLYGVFDGHDGSRVSHFAAQRMPAELLLGQLSHKTEDEDIKDILLQAFISVEKGYFDSIDDILAEKANLMLQVPDVHGVNPYEPFRQFPEHLKRLEQIEAEISGGATAVVSLIYNSKLYVANTGCSRALLCKTDNMGVLRVQQLSVDHNLFNEDELLRLSNIGVDVDKLRQVGKIGNHDYTRSIGDYVIKTSYKDMEIFESARSDPVIADPEVTNGIEIDSSCGFLILMSYGLYKSYEDATGNTEHVNADIAAMVAAEFNIQSTLNGVTQAVVDRVVRIHHDTFMTSTDFHKELCQKRKDITLLVRNFNYPLPYAVSSPSVKSNPMSPALAGHYSEPPSVIIPPPGSGDTPPLPALRPFTLHTTLHTNQSSISTLSTQTNTHTHTYTSSNDSTQSGEDAKLFRRRSRLSNPLELDEDGKVAPYVDFSDFYKAIDELTEAQRETLHADTEPKPAYETIPEEGPPSLSSSNTAAVSPDESANTTSPTADSSTPESPEKTDPQTPEMTG